MRYWRLLFVSFLLTFSIAGCHRKPERALPPPQAQPPIISTLPAMPPLTLHAVELAQPTPAQPVPPPAATTLPPKKHPSKVRRRRTTPKTEPDTETTETRPATTGTPASGAAAATAPPPPASTTALIGQLSADDSAATPTQAAQTKSLIDSTERELKKLSTKQQTDHKDAVAQVNSFLAQARQALNMNDVVGAQTLANKAKILVDELLK
jgi:hypothetical protein